MRIGHEQTALALTLGPSQPDTMLPPDAVLHPAACRQEDVAAGEAAMRHAVRAVMAAEAMGSMQGALAFRHTVASFQLSRRTAAHQMQLCACTAWCQTLAGRSFAAVVMATSMLELCTVSVT